MKRKKSKAGRAGNGSDELDEMLREEDAEMELGDRVMAILPAIIEDALAATENYDLKPDEKAQIIRLLKYFLELTEFLGPVELMRRKPHAWRASTGLEMMALMSNLHKEAKKQGISLSQESMATLKKKRKR